MTLSFFVPGTPRPQGSKVAFVQRGKARMLESSKGLAQWRKDVGEAAMLARRGFYAKNGTPVRVTLAFFLATEPTAPPDIDKLTRACLDACTGVLWHDDAQVVAVMAHKHQTDPDGARITVTT